MSRFQSLILAMMMPVASLSMADESSATASMEPIYNVVSLVFQRCSAPATIQWVVHPERSAIQRSGLLPFGDLPYRVNFAQIDSYREWTAAIRLHDRSRGVDDNYVLLTKTGLAPFSAAYVVTELPEDITDSEQALQIVMQMQRRNAELGKISFIRAETPFGAGLEMVVGGRVGSTCFPTSHFKYAEFQQAPSIGISRFVVRDRHLIEYALTLPWPEGAPQEEAITIAQTRMNAFERGLEPVTY